MVWVSPKERKKGGGGIKMGTKPKKAEKDSPPQGTYR